MRTLLLAVASTLLTFVPSPRAQTQQQPASPVAQDPDAQSALAAGKKRLSSALDKTAALQDTAFTAEWAPSNAAKAQDNPFAAMMAGRSAGKTSGSWHPNLAICKFDGDEGDELVTAGRRTIARSDDHAWAVRSGRFADGNNVNFVPDVEMLLQLLADWQLAVVHRDVGAIDDRPVEIITVTLNDDQVTEAAWSGVLPPSLVSGVAGAVFRFAAGGGAGGRQAASKPKAIVDIAIAIDPGTSLVHRLLVRSYAEETGPNLAMRAGGAQVLVARGGNIQVAGQQDEAEEEEGIDETGPMQFENGLPKRSHKKKSVSDFTVRLSDHGVKTAPGLTDEQKKLLGVR